MHPEAQLKQLMDRFPLPGGYALTDTYFDRMSLGDLDLWMAGLIAKTTGDGQEAVGAAVEETEIPVARAYFELLERICAVLAEVASTGVLPEINPQGEVVGEFDKGGVFPASEDPDAWVYSKSSGVALHTDTSRACRSAMNELFERDAALRAWYGRTELRPLSVDGERFHSWAYGVYTVTACEFISAVDAPRSVGILALPLDPEQAPLGLAFAARQSLEEALDAAEAELLQRAAFLWGEDIPEHTPPFSPHVDYHQDYYLVPGHHPLLAEFFSRGHQHFLPAQSPSLHLGLAGLRFADLTPAELRGELRVVRAIHPSAMPLRFGRDPNGAHLPAQLQVHPIP